MTNTYCGCNGHDVTVERKSASGRIKIVPLPPRCDIVLHSRKSFAWGHGGGSGAAQLALAILCYECGGKVALRLYGAYTWEVVAKLPAEWRITGGEVREWVAGHEQRIKRL